jgi:hypothetical protein
MRQDKCVSGYLIFVTIASLRNLYPHVGRAGQTYLPPSKIDQSFLKDQTRDAIRVALQEARKYIRDPEIAIPTGHPAAIALIAVITWETSPISSASFSKSYRDGAPPYTVSFLPTRIFLVETKQRKLWIAAYDAMSDDEKAKLHLTGPEQRDNVMTLTIHPRGPVSPMIVVEFYRWHEGDSEDTVVSTGKKV